MALKKKKCLMINCSNYESEEGQVFHNLPRDPEKRKKWLTACGVQQKYAATTVLHVCEDHFKDEDYFVCKSTVAPKRKKLKADAIPHSCSTTKNVGAISTSSSGADFLATAMEVSRKRCSQENLDAVATEAKKNSSQTTIQSQNFTFASTRTATNASSSKIQSSNAELFTVAELEALDSSSIPGPVDPQHLDKIMADFRSALHEKIVTCVSCDQFCSISEGEFVNADAEAAEFLAPLAVPTNVPPLHPILLEQYDISSVVNSDIFKGLLLSPRGVEKHKSDCSLPANCHCVPQLFICEEFGCYRALERRTLSKDSIANGNYIGILPEELRDMTYGTLALLRFVQPFGRITSFQWSALPSGFALKGHLYTAMLNTPLIRSSLPLFPNEPPVHVIIASPFASDSAACNLGKMAAAKADYAVEPDKIAKTLEFWKTVENKVVAELTINNEALAAIANLKKDADGKTYAESMFLHVNTAESNREDNSRMQNDGSDDTTSGPSLLRSNAELGDAVFTSATVTVNARRSSDFNCHQQVADILDGPSQDQQTFIVRPEQKFASANDPHYFDALFDDLSPFGRATFGEIRKKPMSKPRIIRRTLNLSTGQFQRIDYVLPMCDFVNLQLMKQQAFVRARLPSFHVHSDGSRLSKAEVFGQVPVDDLKAASRYKTASAAAAKAGIRQPKPPTNVSGLSMEFFRDLAMVTQPMQHSKAAASRDRQNIYAVHNNNGKAQIWFTLSPDDTQCWKIMWYALGEDAAGDYRSTAPSGSFRFDLVSKKPVAAALYFKRLLKLVIKYIIGWDVKNGQPYRQGGIFGTAKAWLRVVKEQARLTLHAHFLVWLYGHKDISAQLNEAFARAAQHMKIISRGAEAGLTSVPGVDEEMDTVLDGCSRSSLSTNVCTPGLAVVTSQEPEFMGCAPSMDHAYQNQGVAAVNSENPFHRLLAIFTKYIVGLSSAELFLPEEEMDVLLRCPTSNCGMLLQIKSKDDLENMRKRAAKSSGEPAILKCQRCSSTFTISERLAAALDHGYNRCYGRVRLSEEETISLKWSGLAAKPDEDDVLAFDRWQLQLASIQLNVNLHDWKHRASCFKQSCGQCRYHLPQSPVTATSIVPIIDHEESKDGKRESIVTGVTISLQRRPPFALFTECNIPFLSVVNYNNCTRYVVDQKVSMYLSSYVTKHCTENEKELAEVFRLLDVYLDKTATEQQNQDWSEL